MNFYFYFFVETTIEVSEDAVSPQMQPLQLIYYPSRSVERFTLALPDINGDAVTVTADEGSELWLMCSPENPNGFKNMEAKITGTAIVRNEPPAAGWQLSHTKCKNKVTASIHNTRTQCAQNTGTIYEVGFLVRFQHWGRYCGKIFCHLLTLAQIFQSVRSQTGIYRYC